MYKNIQRCIKTYKDVSKHTKMYQNIQRCIKTYKDVSKHKQCIKTYRKTSLKWPLQRRPKNRFSRQIIA